MITKKEIDTIHEAIKIIISEDGKRKDSTNGLRFDPLPSSRYFDPGSGLLNLIAKTDEPNTYIFLLNNTEFCTKSATLEPIAAQLFVNYIFPSSLKCELDLLLSKFLNANGELKDDALLQEILGIEENANPSELFETTLKTFLIKCQTQLEECFKTIHLPDPKLMAEYFLKAILMTYISPANFSTTVKNCFRKVSQEIIQPIDTQPIQTITQTSIIRLTQRHFIFGRRTRTTGEVATTPIEERRLCTASPREKKQGLPALAKKRSDPPMLEAVQSNSDGASSARHPLTC